MINRMILSKDEFLKKFVNTIVQNSKEFDINKVRLTASVNLNSKARSKDFESIQIDIETIESPFSKE